MQIVLLEVPEKGFQNSRKFRVINTFFIGIRCEHTQLFNLLDLELKEKITKKALESGCTFEHFQFRNRPPLSPQRFQKLCCGGKFFKKSFGKFRAITEFSLDDFHALETKTLHGIAKIDTDESQICKLVQIFIGCHAVESCTPRNSRSWLDAKFCKRENNTGFFLRKAEGFEVIAQHIVLLSMKNTSQITLIII